MKTVYAVSGMTCGGCKASVEKSLLNIDEVQDVKVNLEKAEAIIKSDIKLPTNLLQASLAEKFTISEKLNVNTFVQQEQKSTVRQLYPLFLIFVFITVASILISINPWSFSNFMLTFMGLFYVVFSFFKFLDVKGFANSFSMYDPLAKQIKGYGLIYPFIELALGVFFLTRFQITFSLIVTIVILGVTTVGVTKSLLSKQTIQCACLGSVLNLPMTKATFIENSIMIVMAVLMLFGI